MFGLFGGAKFFLIVITMPQDSSVGSIRAAEYNSLKQCEAAATEANFDYRTAYTCMSDEDYGLLLKYGQAMPIFGARKEAPAPVAPAPAPEQMGGAPLGGVLLEPKCVTACSPVIISE